MNVTQLKSLAKDLDIKGYSKLNKADLVAVTTGQMEALHTAAIIENDKRDKDALKATLTEAPAFKGLTIHQRLSNYRKQNGGRKLTAKQTARILSKMHRDFKRGHTLETILGKAVTA